MPDPDISVVIPLRDEEENVVPLHRELADVLDQLGVSYEVILVDDGSADGTFEQLAMVQAQDPKVKAVRFTRNFGQTAAFAAGFSAARGQYIVTLDGDLQNDPRDIPGMLALARRKDIVSGWRRKRQDSFVTRHLPSAIANWLLGIITGVRLHDNGCSLKVYRANVVKPLKLRPGMHRYLPAIASQLGGRVAEVEVHHRPRRHGRSKYNLSRTFRVVADLVQLRRLMREAVDPDAPAP
ncbi:MAG TPA: glycosyltransferase family 2 protein, partial [Vicinamibacterales bacterium]|nr:glycosyltransferase family 2 protein [Vicinamibacterales bacterium]